MIDVEDYEKIRQMITSCDKHQTCSTCPYVDCDNCCQQSKYEMWNLIYCMKKAIGNIPEDYVGDYGKIKQAMAACNDEYGQCTCSICPYERGCENCCQNIKHDMWRVIQGLKAIIDK